MARVAPTSNAVVFAFALLAALLVMPGVAGRAANAQGTPRLVADLVQTPSEGDGPGEIVPVGDVVFFTQNDGEHGVELWRTDGSAEGTVLVADVRPGARGSNPHALTAVGDRLFFVADDGVHGAELWTSDGTGTGTRLVREIRDGPAGADPGELTALGATLLFVADDGVSGAEPWASDGTASGTRLVRDVRPGPASSQPRDLTALDGFVFFAADDGSFGTEPWLTDGTAQGTFAEDLMPGAAGSDPADPIAYAGAVYFGARAPDVARSLWKTDIDGLTFVANVDLQAGDADVRPLVGLDGDVLFRVAREDVGSELWRTGGAPGEEQRLAAFDVGYLAPAPSRAVVMGSHAYFVGSDATVGSTLMRTDGTPDGTIVIEDFNLRPCSKEFTLPIVAGGRLFFRARAGRDEGELFVSDGSAGGAQRVADIFPGNEGSKPRSRTAAGDKLYFSADDGLHGRELWVSDGTADGTHLVADIFPGTVGGFDGRAHLRLLSPVGATVLFTGSDGRPSTIPAGLWRSDGTPAGTAPVPLPDAVIPGGSLLRAATRSYFFAWEGRSTLWSTDGTAAGSVRAIDPMPPVGHESTFAMLGDSFFFTGEAPATGEELWFSDGTTAGTRLLRDALPGSIGVRPLDVVVAGSRVFYSAEDLHGRELWTSDGTAAGTRMVADIQVGFFASALQQYASYLTPFGDDVYFVADNGNRGRELWRSDGTAQGTYLVRDVHPGSGAGVPTGYRPLVLGDTLLFTANDGQSGLELWRSDGTTAGTVRVKDIFPGPFGAAPSLGTVVGSWAYFYASDPAHGRELWRTDGTEAGTTLVKDIVPGPAGSVAEFGQVATAVGPYLYFSAHTPEHGDELWVTDGTASGTYLVADINADAGSAPDGAVNADGRLFFLADDGVHGTELWVLSCGDGVVDPGEACDDGAENDAPSSCCTSICTVHPGDADGDGTGDRCDATDGTLDLRRARLRADPPSPRADGTVVLDGHLVIDPSRGDSFDATRGLLVSVRDGGTVTTEAVWAPGECAATRGGVMRCRNAARDALARFTRAAPDEAGRSRWFFHVRLSRRTLGGPFAGPVEVRLTHDAHLDRAGALARCNATASGLSCRR